MQLAFSSTMSRSKGLIQPGTWNVFDDTVSCETVSLTINGKPAYTATGLKNRIGYLGLQNHSTPVKFRRLRLGPPQPE